MLKLINIIIISFKDLWLCFTSLFLCFQIAYFFSKNDDSLQNYVYILVMVFISLVYTSYKNLIPKKIEIPINNSNKTITILFKDIIKEDGNIVFLSSNYFNTKMSIISEKTLLGQYIKNKLNGDNTFIDKQIDSKLLAIATEKNTRPCYVDNVIEGGKHYSYNMGTIASFSKNDGKRKCFLMALSEIKDNISPEGKLITSTVESDIRTKIKYLTEGLNNLWDTAENELDSVPLDITPFGTGNAKIFENDIQSILFIINSYILSSKARNLNLRIFIRGYDPIKYNRLKHILGSYLR